MRVPQISSGGRYPVLRAVGILCIIFAGISVLAGLYFAAWCFTLPETWAMRLIYSAGSLVAAFVAVVGFLGAAETLKMFIDIERHARTLATRGDGFMATSAPAPEPTRVNRMAEFDEETAEAALMRGH